MHYFQEPWKVSIVKADGDCLFYIDLWCTISTGGLFCSVPFFVASLALSLEDIMWLEIRLSCDLHLLSNWNLYIEDMALVNQTGQFNPNRGFCLVDTLDLCDSFHSSVFCLPLICLLCITCWILNCQYLFQASPILIGGRQAFVEEKKTTSRGKFLFACAIGWELKWYCLAFGGRFCKINW